MGNQGITLQANTFIAYKAPNITQVFNIDWAAVFNILNLANQILHVCDVITRNVNIL